MDDLFAEQLFDERDLVRIDKEINAKYEEINKRIKQSEKASLEVGSEKP